MRIVDSLIFCLRKQEKMHGVAIPHFLMHKQNMEVNLLITVLVIKKIK
jgi:hypothetical protein